MMYLVYRQTDIQSNFNSRLPSKQLQPSKNIISTETYQFSKHPAPAPQGDIVKNKTEITYY